MKHEIAVGDEAGEIKVFSNLDGKLVYLDSVSHGAPVVALAYSPDGARLVSGDDMGRILIWKID